MNSEIPQSKKQIFHIGLWAILHIALIVAVVLAYPWKIDKSLYSVLPKSDISQEFQNAESEFSSRSATQLLLFVGDSDFSVAKAAANEIGKMLSESQQIESATWLIDSNSLGELSEFFYKNRFALQDPSLLQMSDSARANYLYHRALSRTFGALPTSSLSHLQEDPYLLSQNAQERLLLKNPLLSGNLSLREGMLTVEDSGKTYVLVNAKMLQNASDMASDGHIISLLEDKMALLQKAHPNLSFECSGVPFHSYSSSQKAQREVAWISGISGVAVLLLLLLAFRSPLPILSILVSIVVAILAAIGATLATFHEIHIFTFVFGTSVIGVSIDYALHHFADRNFQIKSILLGFMTTELSYIALMIVNFPVLRQMAFFSMVGLASALLSVLLIFPIISRKLEKRNQNPPVIIQLALKGYSKAESIPRKVRYIIFAVLLGLLLPGFFKLNLQTDLRTLYKIAPDLEKSEIKIAKWMNSGISPHYFIVRGNSIEDVLQKEENLKERLWTAQKDSLIESVLAFSDFAPSAHRQRQLDSALRRSLPIRYAALKKAMKIPKRQQLEYPAIQTDLEKQLPQQFENFRDMLWIGQLDSSYYSAVLPLHATKEFCADSFASPDEGIYAVNKMETVNHALTELSMTALALVAFAYFSVFFILSFVYTWKDSLRIVRAPILACLFTMSMFGYMEIPVNFFAITGLILVLGIGIDYSLFFKEAGDDLNSTAFAVILSTLTTLISFGTLALSSFAPVSILGLTVLLGISASLCLSPFARK